MSPARTARFFAGVWTGSAPLLVWAAHFAFCYVAVAVACSSAPASPPADLPALRWTLATATAFAAAVLATLLWRSCRPAATDGHARLVRRIVAVLSLVGVAWASVPMALLPACSA